ncbi:hypothetical protein BDV12DRAFT_192464 [Aspergillus spectabilis]
MARGLRVVTVDTRDKGLEVCRKYQAEAVLDAREGTERVVQQVQVLIGVNATINLSDHETAAALACAITRPHGTLAQAAQPERVSVPFGEFIVRDITIKWTMFAGVKVSQQMLQETSQCGHLAEVTAFQGLLKVPKMLELARSGKLKGKVICVVDGNLK